MNKRTILAICLVLPLKFLFYILNVKTEDKENNSKSTYLRAISHISSRVIV